MIKKIKTGLEYVADFYRTAPLGETMFIVHAAQIPYLQDEPWVLGLNAFCSLAGVLSSKKQFKLRRRLENKVAEYGYSDSAFEKTIPAWCDRQVGRVVAKNSGNLEDYIALCESNKDKMNLPHLRNF